MLEDCNIQILLSFCRNMFLHMRTAHPRFGCIAPNGPLLLSNIHSRQIYFPSVRISCIGFYQDCIIPCRRFRGWRCFGVVCPSFLFLSIHRAMEYGKLTNCEVWLASYHWPSGKAVSYLQIPEESTGYVWHLGRSLEMANNGVKPHTDKNKQVADNWE